MLDENIGRRCRDRVTKAGQRPKGTVAGQKAGITLDMMNSYALEPIGFIRSTVKGREDAPRQGPEGAPDAWLEIEPQFAEALLGLEVGHELIVITWLHEAKRCVLKNHPRSDESRPLTGVFYTR